MRCALFPRKSPQGLSAIELTITLAISSMLVAGTFLWYGSQRSVQFYDGARQVESQIKEVQTAIAANEVPEPSVNPSSSTSPTPVIPSDHVVFAVSLTADTANSQQLVARYYAARYSDAGIGDIDTIYQTKTFQLPSGVLYDGVHAVASGTACSAQNYNTWSVSDLPPNTLPTVGTSTIAFRRDPASYHHFLTPEVDPSYTAWGGDNPVLGQGSKPCAVMWMFKSREENGPGVPRYRFEVVFNLVNTTTRLVTH